MIVLQHCPKGYTTDGDKAVTPASTVARVKGLPSMAGRVLAETRRIDTGRLDIPVFLSICGENARKLMPTRKQMGKGASPEQAEASALMELVERYSFFSFWETPQHFTQATWSEAESLFGEALMPLEHVLLSVNESMTADQARKVMDIVQWRFCPVTDLVVGKEVYAPLDWFKKLGEFNGSCAGNTPEESLLQGLCELVERHVCAVIDRQRPELPTIDAQSSGDPVLQELCAKFDAQGIRLVLKDFSLGFPVPTVGALAWDPATWPGSSEVVLTAGTAASPVKAAIRAVTEVAQLAGDFESGSVYEASGLHKPASPEDAAWLTQGTVISLDTLPSLESEDILCELQALLHGLQEKGYPVYAVDLTHPDLELPAHYTIAPGLQFRERDRNASLGMFVGRTLAEEADPIYALHALDELEEVYEGAHFMQFYRGLVDLRLEDPGAAVNRFLDAEANQPDDDSRGLVAFYAGYAFTLMEQWAEAEPCLRRAAAACPEMKEYFNLLGASLYKQQRYEEASREFEHALALDKGSAVDLANLGACCRFLGRNDHARECLETALELDPGLDFARVHLESLGT